MGEAIQHVVKPGDCLSKIAVEYGLTWQQIWNDGANAALKQERKDPNVLYPGDVVSVPAKKNKVKQKSTGQKHNFKRKKEQSKIILRLLVDNEPVKNVPCRLEVAGQPDRLGQVNGNGDVAIEGETEFTLHSSITFAKLHVGEEPHCSVYKLYIGHLNPYDTLTGMQQRLNNLGYQAGPNDGVVGPRTEAAIRWFQEDQNLKVDGKPTEEVMSKLKATHES